MSPIIHSHLLAQRRNVPTGLDDSLAAVMMLVQLVAEPFKDGRELVAGNCHFWRRRGLLGLAAVVSLLGRHVVVRSISVVAVDCNVKHSCSSCGGLNLRMWCRCRCGYLWRVIYGLRPPLSGPRLSRVLALSEIPCSLSLGRPANVALVSAVARRDALKCSSGRTPEILTDAVLSMDVHTLIETSLTSLCKEKIRVRQACVAMEQKLTY